MKKKITSVLLALCMVLSLLPCGAYAADSDFTIADGVLTKYNGSGGDVVIPDTVTSIGDNAFEDCTGLTSITIPDSVTSIGDSAFHSCSALTSVTIGNSVTSIASCAFLSCSSLTSITIPNSVTSIGRDVFHGCTGLTSVTIGNSVTSIGGYAFFECTGLTSVTIPNSVTSIDDNAFDHCTSLTRVTIPNSVTSIGSWAFSFCSSLTSITIPNSVTSIGAYAFWSCSSLTSITIPSSVTFIGSDAFAVCTGLISVSIPDSVTFIGEYAFRSCDSLTSITIPTSFTSISKGIFDSCTGLTSVTIPNNVTSIAMEAFEDCTGLTSVTIPNSVTIIGDQAFNRCTRLTDVYYAGSEEQWGKITIRNYNEPLTSATIHYNCNSTGPGGDEPEDPSNPEITTSVRFLSGFDSSSRKATFGDSEKISLETHTVAEGIDVNQFLNKYVLVTEEQKESSLEYDVTDIQAVDSKIGTVTNTETDGLYLTSMTIDEIKYSVPREKCLSLSSLIDSKVLYHVYSGQVVGFEEIQYKTGRLDKYNQSTNRVTIDGQEYATNYMTDWSFINRFDELEGRRIGYYTGNVLEGKTSRPFLFEIVDSNESSYIKMYATDDDLAISPNDSFDVICTLVRNDQTATQWNKPAVVVGNTDVISLSNYSLDSKGYHFTVTGLKEGNSSLIVSDSETGAHITASISVSKEDIVPYSYRIDKIPEFYPNVTGDKKTKTNFYNLNGMYVKDYAATENKDDGSWDISFKVYNHRYMYGAVDIYDEKGNWKDSEMIEKYTEIGGIYETGEAAVWLVIDGYNGNALSYTAHTWSKCTPIAINVPKGGYFTISNNYLLSPGAYLFNTMDLLVWSASTIVSEGLDLSKSEEVVKKAKEELTTSALVRNEYVKKLQSIGTSVAKNVGQDSAIADQLCSLEDIGEEIFEQTLDWKAIFKNTTSLGESAFEKLMGPIGETMKILFDFSSYLSYGAQTINLGQSINKQYVTIFTPQNSGSMTVNGVTVTPTQEAIDSDTILQVFRISTNDRIVILDNEIVADQYELYNICFVKDDQEIQPNGKVTVRVPVPNGFDGEHCTIYRQEPDGTWSVLSAYVDGDYLVFETDHFSMYVVAQTTFPTSKPTSNPKPTSDPISTPSSNPKPTNNPTSAPTSTPQPTNSPSSNPSPSPNPWKNPFPDVSNTAWYIKAVEYVATEGLMGGYPNGKFGPNNQISRAEFAQIMYNKAGRPNAGTSIFSDVKSGQWYAKAVNWAAEQKVVSGIGNNLFAPERDITREELATMLWRYAESPKPVKTTLDFTDANKVSNFAKEALLWANENGIISGKGNGILDPKGNATRAEAAQMLMNYLKK